MISETRVYPVNPYTSVLAKLKTAIKADVTDLRAQKAAVRQAQRDRKESAPADQSNLYSAKQTARARLLISGFIRGMALERMERKSHQPCPSYYLKRVWKDAVEGTEDLPVPELVKQHVL